MAEQTRRAYKYNINLEITGMEFSFLKHIELELQREKSVSRHEWSVVSSIRVHVIGNRISWNKMTQWNVDCLKEVIRIYQLRLALISKKDIAYNAEKLKLYLLQKIYNNIKENPFEKIPKSLVKAIQFVEKRYGKGNSDIVNQVFQTLEAQLV